MTIEYINTDLDLESTTDLNPLAMEFETLGVFSLNVTVNDHDLWVANFETLIQFDAPENCIEALLDAVGKLSVARHVDWSQCKTRQFNIGIKSGTEPHSLCLQLSNSMVRRIADAGATVGITIYRDCGSDQAV